MTKGCSVDTGADGRSLQLRGTLTFDCAAAAHAAGLEKLAAQSQGSSVEVDCAGVTHADSSGLAVLLDWMREATRAGYSLRFANLPNSLLQLARISEVSNLFKVR